MLWYKMGSRPHSRNSNWDPTPNFVHCPLKWATLEIRFYPFILWFGQLFSIWPKFLNLAIRAFEEEFVTPVENFTMIDRASRTIVEKNNSRIRCFHFDMSLGHFVAINPLAPRLFLYRNHCATSARFCWLANATKRSAQFIAFEFVPVFLFWAGSYVDIAWVLSTLYIRYQGSRL